MARVASPSATNLRDVQCRWGMQQSEQRLILPLLPPSRRHMLALLGTAGACDLLWRAPLALPASAALHASQDEGLLANVVRITAPSVVAVGTMQPATGGEAFQPIASGVVWDSYGHIVTSYTPINKALRQNQPVRVAILQDTSLIILAADVIARDPSLEVLVLGIPIKDNDKLTVQPVKLARTAELRVGQTLLAVGSTGTAGRLATAGVVSAVGRTVPAVNGQVIRGAIQTDADIAPLTLGGGLFTSDGALAGIPVMRYSPQGVKRSSGVNFALASDTLASAVPSLIVYGNTAGRR